MPPFHFFTIDSTTFKTSRPIHFETNEKGIAERRKNKL